MSLTKSKSFTTLGCYGYSYKKGGRVGQRHRWPDGWGKGQCEWCGRCLDQVRFPDKPSNPRSGTDAHLADALRTTR